MREDPKTRRRENAEAIAPRQSGPQLTGSSDSDTFWRPRYWPV